MRITSLLLAVMLCVLGIGSAGIVHGAPAPKCKVQGGTLRYGLVRDPTTFDPHINDGVTSSSIQGNVYDGLVEFGPDGEVAPALAESWMQPTPSTYVFRLRHNVTFHDGTPFTAADVLYTFQRIQDPKTAATRQLDLKTSVRAIKAVDPYTVEIDLTQPTATFLQMLAAREMYIVSKAWGDRGGDFKRAMNGTGSYRLASYEPHVRYVLERYAKAWNTPCIDRIEMTPINNDQARMDALKSGQVDFTEYVIWQETEYFFTHPGFRVYRGRDLFDFVRLNPNRPPLDRPQVRQALNFAINRQTINIVAFGGQGLPMEGFLTKPDSWAYNPDTSKVWKYDPKRATALLADAGLKPQDLHLTFEADPGPETFDPAQVILTELRQLGVNVDFKIIDIPTLVKKRANGDFLLLMDGKSLPWNDPDAYFDFFYSAGTNYAAAVKFKNTQLDQLLERGRTTTNPALRKPMYAGVERILYQQAPWIFAVWRPQAEAGRSFVKGYVRLPGALGTYTPGHFNRLWIEK